jgi:hypothetical protein
VAHQFEDGGARKVENAGDNVSTSNERCTYLPDRSWILNDTHPQAGFQRVYLYNVSSHRQVA